MRILNLSTAIVSTALLFSCSNAKHEKGNNHEGDGHNSQNSVDWEGTYNGTLQFKEAQNTAITIKYDNTYTMKVLNKSDENATTFTGKVQWNTNGSHITLDKTPVGNLKLQVGENTLIQNEDYNLKKSINDKNIVGIKWNLVAIEGTPIKMKGDGKAPFLQLQPEFGRANGNFGCNNFFGSFTIPAEGQLYFSQFGATLMACPDLDLESAFHKNLSASIFYIVNGKELIFKNEADKIILKFEKEK